MASKYNKFPVRNITKSFFFSLSAARTSLSCHERDKSEFHDKNIYYVLKQTLR